MHNGWFGRRSPVRQAQTSHPVTKTRQFIHPEYPARGEIQAVQVPARVCKYRRPIANQRHEISGHPSAQFGGPKYFTVPARNGRNATFEPDQDDLGSIHGIYRCFRIRAMSRPAQEEHTCSRKVSNSGWTKILIMPALTCVKNSAPPQGFQCPPVFRRKCLAKPRPARIASKDRWCKVIGSRSRGAEPRLR